MSSTNFRSILTLVSCVVGTCNILVYMGEFFLGGVLFFVHYNGNGNLKWISSKFSTPTPNFRVRERRLIQPLVLTSRSHADLHQRHNAPNKSSFAFKMDLFRLRGPPKAFAFKMDLFGFIRGPPTPTFHIREWRWKCELSIMFY